MSEIFNFIDKKLISIKPPNKGQVMYRDKKEQGLVLRVSYAGSKTFSLYKRINGKPRLIKVGEFPKTSISEARITVRDLKSKIEKGEKLHLDKTNVEALTFIQLFNKYIDNYAKLNTKSYAESQKAIKLNAQNLFNKDILTINKHDILEIFNCMSKRGTYGANRFFDTLKAIFNKAIEWDLLDKNPANGIKKHKEISRDRYITLEEKEQFLKAVEEDEDQQTKDFVLLALYTGARKGNILSMSWENIDFGNKTWYIPDTKNGDPRNAVLTDDAIEILERRKKEAKGLWVFPSDTSKSGHFQEPRKGWARIVKRSGLKNLRIHDLRRTCGSWMAINGASPYIIGKALNHKDPKSTAIYARLNQDPVREHLERAVKLSNGELQKRIDEAKKNNE